MMAAIIKSATNLEGFIAKFSRTSWTLGPWLPPHHLASWYVTVHDKTRHVGFFAKIAIAISINSTTLELTLLQIWDRSPVPFPRYSAFYTPSRELLNLRNYGPSALLRKLILCGTSRSNEASEQITTRMTRLWPSSSSFSRPLEKNSYQPLYSTNLPHLVRLSN